MNYVSSALDGHIPRNAVKWDVDIFEDQVIECKRQNMDKLSKEKLNIIHPDIYVKYNSLNVLCGPQGSGKTWTACKEIAKISQIDPHAHLLIIVCKAENRNDPTVQTLLPLIKIPVEFITEDIADEYVREILTYKQLYNEIKDEHLETKIQDQQRDEIFQKLKIQDFSRSWLHTMLMINDSAKCSLLKSGSYFADLIALGRHTQMSTFLNIQFWKGLSPEIKANISSAFVFGQFARQQLVHILSQLPSQYDYKDIYPHYKHLDKQDKMIFTDGSVRLG